MALGAAQAQILLKGALSALLGGLVGLICDLIVGGAIQNLLYKMSPCDPVGYAVAVLLFSAAAVTASFIPARSAALLHPLQALRYE